MAPLNVVLLDKIQQLGRFLVQGLQIEKGSSFLKPLLRLW